MDDRDVLATDWIRWPDRRGPYLVELTWARVDQRVECVAVRVSGGCQIEGADMSAAIVDLPGQRRQRVPTEAIRSIPFASLIDDRRQRHLRTFDRGRTVAIDDAAPGYRALRDAWAGEGSPPRGWEPDHWRKVAEVYLEAWQRGEPPTKAVQEHFSVSKSAAAKWVAKCRNELGLIEQTTKGKAAGAAGKDDE